MDEVVAIGSECRPCMPMQWDKHRFYVNSLCPSSLDWCDRVQTPTTTLSVVPSCRYILHFVCLEENGHFRQNSLTLIAWQVCTIPPQSGNSLQYSPPPQPGNRAVPHVVVVNKPSLWLSVKSSQWVWVYETSLSQNVLVILEVQTWNGLPAQRYEFWKGFCWVEWAVLECHNNVITGD